MSDFLAARVHPWQAFRIRKWAEHAEQPLGIVLMEAIQVYLGEQHIPPELAEAWLKEYQEIKTTKEAAHANVD